MLKTKGYPKVVLCAVTDTVRELEEELRNKQLLSQARKQRNLLESLAQEGFIRQLLYGTKAVLAAEIAANFERLDIPLDPLLRLIRARQLDAGQEAIRTRTNRMPRWQSEGWRIIF